jgi:hypothetical protein
MRLTRGFFVIYVNILDKIDISLARLNQFLYESSIFQKALVDDFTASFCITCCMLIQSFYAMIYKWLSVNQGMFVQSHHKLLKCNMNNLQCPYLFALVLLSSPQVHYHRHYMSIIIINDWG